MLKIVIMFKTPRTLECRSNLSVQIKNLFSCVILRVLAMIMTYIMRHSYIMFSFLIPLPFISAWKDAKKFSTMLNAYRAYMLSISQFHYEVRLFCEGIFSEMMFITFFTMNQNFEVMFYSLSTFLNSAWYLIEKGHIPWNIYYQNHIWKRICFYIDVLYPPFCYFI